MFKAVEAIIRILAMQYGVAPRLFRRVCSPNGEEYAAYLRRYGGFHAIGDYCSILPDAVVTDPYLVQIGNNVRLSACTLLCHDGSINVLNRAYGVKLDRVGPIVIKDNVFVGYGAKVMPGVTIGPNAIVGAGAVVTKDVPEGAIVAGVPARRVGNTEDLVRKLREQTELLPWAHIIRQRESAFDRELEPTLRKMRVEFYFGASPRPEPAVAP